MNSEPVRTSAHLARLEEALTHLWSDRAKAVARQLDASLAPLSVFWGEEDGEPYVEWAGGAKEDYVVRLHSF